MPRKSKAADYWEIIEPHWKRVNIYDGAKPFMADFKRLPKPIGHLLAAQWCQSEVCNGGFHQFFHNSTGVLAPEALEGFEAIGLDGLAAALAKAMAFFGERYPRSREVRIRKLDTFSRPVGKAPKNARASWAWNPFEDLDDEFYRVLATKKGNWENAANSFAVQYRDAEDTR